MDRSELVHEVARNWPQAQPDGTTAVGVTADLETFEGASAAIEAALKYGRIDVLINNVGGTIWAKPFEHYDPDEISKEIRRSLFPTLWTCRAVLPHMISQQARRHRQRLLGGDPRRQPRPVCRRQGRREGHHRGAGPGSCPARNPRGCHRARRHRGPAAQGRSAAPQPDGEQEKAWYQQIVDQTIDSSLMKRYGTLDEQAGPIVFLASDEASYITGSVLAVAGGDLG